MHRDIQLLQPCRCCLWCVTAVVHAGQEWCDCEWHCAHPFVWPLQPGLSGERATQPTAPSSSTQRGLW
jgi:hypothetical protein